MDTPIIGPGERSDMFRRVRETGPALLIPAAWGLVAAAHLGVVTTHPVFVMHVVMSVMLVAFAAASWREMGSGVLRAWRTVILVGTPFAVAGLAGFLLAGGSSTLLAVALYGWMLAPAAGFVYTGRCVAEGGRIHLASAAGCLLGAALYAAGATLAVDAGRLAGLLVVGGAQTAGILDAVIRY